MITQAELVYQRACECVELSVTGRGSCSKVTNGRHLERAHKWTSQNKNLFPKYRPIFFWYRIEGHAEMIA